MNKNFENYKKTYSQIRPSDESIEGVMNMAQKNKHKFSINFKRLAVAALALAILVGGGFGTNYALQKSNSNKELGVLIAYASTGDYIKIGSENEQELFYSLYIAPKDDIKKAESAKKRWRSDYDKLYDELERLGNKGFAASLSGEGGHDCYNADNEETATLYTVRAGSFALNLDDYSKVKSFKVENTSKYGYIEFDYLGQREKMIEMSQDDYFDENHVDTDQDSLDFRGWGHEFQITGDELRRSQKDGLYAGGTKHEVNKGYHIQWQPSLELLYDTIGNNPDFDLSEIKDTITFTVEFNDGTVKTASLNLYFDSDGYMHFEN
ncbi:MAG: hypothetical protein NC213_04195 [Acetobacter sp.]|nr:hypothetical protein [Bacteroides sp.]MCM1340925.1 hypothetical protein [Acetobacter sp.]MCM1432519.1 hypothetical protein [Clostridiales bacterium]